MARDDRGARYLPGRRKPVVPRTPAAASRTSRRTRCPPKPKKAVTLNIIDVAGNLQLTQGMIDEFVKGHSDFIKKVTYTKATAPELPGKDQGAAGRRPGADRPRADRDRRLVGRHRPEPLGQDRRLQGPDRRPELSPARGQGWRSSLRATGVEVTYYPSGPLIEYNPKTVAKPPTTTDELLAWAKAHPKKFQYARPANSGPGRTFIMGLPYLLGDSDPKGPETGWTKDLEVPPGAGARPLTPIRRRRRRR